MARLFNRILVAMLALFFGVSGKVTAQMYGTPTNSYRLKGQVSVIDCPLRIPGIHIILKNNNDELDTAITDSSGRFELNYHSRKFHEELDNLSIEAKDIDGEKNLGRFKTYTCPVYFNDESLKQITRNTWSWVTNYDYDPPLNFMMKPEDQSPCDN